MIRYYFIKEMQTEHTFDIADWKVRIKFACEDDFTGLHLLPSFEPFLCKKSQLAELMTITVDQSIDLTDENECEFISDCKTPNGNVLVSLVSGGGYQYVINDCHGEVCALMLSNDDNNLFRIKVFGETVSQRQFGLNNAMMMAYAFAGACHGTLLIHASLIRKDGVAYAFIAKSGTGKSTQTGNWLKMIPECDLMNDDNPVVRMVDGKAMIYGSPWSGKTPCYRQVKAPLGAVSLISRDTTNWVEKVSPIKAFKELISSCSAMKWDKKTFRGVCDTVSAVVASTGNYTLHCTKEPESAIVCYEGIKVKG